MPIDRTAFNALVDSNGTPGHGSVWDKAAIEDVLLDPIDAAITGTTGSSRAVAFHNTTQSLTSGVDTALNLNSEDVDVGVMHDTSTNTSRVTVPAGAGGLYLALARTFFAANATGNRLLTIRKNGGTELASNNIGTPSSGVGQRVECHWLGVLAAGDYLEIVASQTSGGGLDAGSATRASSSELAVVRVI